eukprot:IDg21125t1
MSRKRGRYPGDFGVAQRAHRRDCSAYSKRDIASLVSLLPSRTPSRGTFRSGPTSQLARRTPKVTPVNSSGYSRRSARPDRQRAKPTSARVPITLPAPVCTTPFATRV